MSGWKVGEWVAVRNGRGRGFGSGPVGQITAVIPSGQAQACGGRWTARGQEVGGGGLWKRYIVRITEAEADRFSRSRALHQRWASLRDSMPPPEVAVSAVLRGHSPGTLQEEIARLFAYRARVDALIEAMQEEVER